MPHSDIYVYPEPMQGFIRLDCIAAAEAAEAEPKYPNIGPRVIVRTIIGGRAGDVVIDCATYEEARARVNEIRRRVEDYRERTWSIETTPVE